MQSYELSWFSKLCIWFTGVVFISSFVYNITLYYSIDGRPKELIPKKYQEDIKQFIENEDQTDIDMGIVEDVTIPYRKDNFLSHVLKAKKIERKSDYDTILATDLKLWEFTIEIDKVTNEEKKVVILSVADFGEFNTKTMNGNIWGNIKIKRIYLDPEVKREW
jgi:hypothetical protein